MSLLCTSPDERARNAYARVLQAMQRPGTAAALAATMGLSEATISRLKTGHIEESLKLITHLGFKIVSTDKTCVDRDLLEFMRKTTASVLADQERSKKLFEGDE